ncbi:Rpn family recombination-promoting nuclease/putative transposase [Dyadobacter sp. CY351]|uniref:Rpn family recombination-promoting nuclease/putative transposase n=1 Tax=Dyadobacter sp. CY351 TaxID=2909337 RepID=UPI001F27CC65|nr:Rpn family recombination-promoting nuclease/putative transposase [Dyadobacter sp. CY351]MCF2516537.1 Rpn family recombination-promoting nuclease/putative transposase [Dyadobacter sp. CY351]
MKRNDILWKSILEDTFEDFLRFFFPEADDVFDFSKDFEYLDKELEQLFPPDNDHYSSKFVDKLVKVFTKEGQEEWILVHIEVQGYTDPHFADRMFTYYYRIWDRYRKRTTALAILTDDNKHYYPSCFEQSFLGTSLRFEFNILKVLDQCDRKLAESDNVFAHILTTVKIALKSKKLSDKDLFDLKIQLARKLLSEKISKPKIAKLMKFLKFYVVLNDPFLSASYSQEVYNLTHKTYTTMGIDEAVIYISREEGKEEGIELGRLETTNAFTEALLKDGRFDKEEIARLVGVPVAFVQEVKARL